MSQDILIVDDEQDIRELISGILEDEGYSTRVASNGLDALAAMKARQPSLVIQDVWLGDSERDGLKVLDVIKRDHPHVPVIMISGHGTIETAVTAIKKGAYDFIEKPFQAERLLVVIERAIESARLKRENEELKIKAGISSDLLGKSSVMNHIRHTIEKTAQTNSRIMITGPHGSGKELLGRKIHDSSLRKDSPFLTLKCSALSPEQIEVELFGTEIRGLDPKMPRKIGLLEKCHKGTLFIEEITHMPLLIQSKFLKVLSDNSFMRVGGTSAIEIDVRYIASSSTDVKAKIATSEFREDLFYRLNIVPIVLPALNERVEDIPLLAHQFLEQTSALYGVAPRKLSDEAVIILQSYPWPGNVRQLKNVMEWVVIMNEQESKDPIRADMLPPEIRSGLPFSHSMTDKAEIVTLPLRQAREIFERDYLLAQVNRCSGNISKTAKFVGMERSALHRKLKALGAYDGREDLKEEA